MASFTPQPPYPWRNNASYPLSRDWMGMAGPEALERRKISSPAETRTITSQSFLLRNAVVMLTDLSRNKFIKCKIKIRKQNTMGLYRTLVFAVVTSLAVCLSAGGRPPANSGHGLMTVIKRARVFR